VLELSRDPVGISEVLDGQDTHALNQIAFELPSRLIAKIYLFRTIFRGTGWSFANDPDFMHVSSDPKYWDAVNEKFYKKYKGIDDTHSRWRDLVMAGKPIVGPLGTEWLISNRDKNNELYVPMTNLTNFPVQGTGADVMMIARISAYNRLKMYDDIKFDQTVHDSISADCPSHRTRLVSNTFYEVFRDLQKNIKKIFGYSWVVPLEGEVKVGMNKADMEEVKYAP
jgi:hypothetical protein